MDRAQSPRRQWSKRKLAFRDDQQTFFGPRVRRFQVNLRLWWAKADFIQRFTQVWWWLVCAVVGLTVGSIVAIVLWMPG